MPGPPPTRNPRRRNARPDWRRLPIGGRTGEPPAWPLGRLTKAKRELWVRLWASPQAVAWEELGCERIVARYVCLLVDAEVRGAPSYLLTEARQLEGQLGLTPIAMKRLMWEVVEDQAETPADVTSLDDYRNQLG